MKKSSTCEGDMLKELSRTIVALTTSGKKSLDETSMKKLKKICRTSDKYIQDAYRLLMKQLRQHHAEIRLSAFHLCDQLFRRSHCFRHLLVTDFQHFLELAVETNPDRPLPPPKHIAKILKQEALHAVRQWYTIYGKGYKKLVLGYNFLRQCKKVDFQSLQDRDAAEERVHEEEERRHKLIFQERLKKVKQEMQDRESDIIICLTQMNSCFNLLLPHPMDFFIQESEETAGAGSNTTTAENKREKYGRVIVEETEKHNNGQLKSEKLKKEELENEYSRDIAGGTDKHSNEHLKNEKLKEEELGNWEARDTNIHLINKEKKVQSKDCLENDMLMEPQCATETAREHGLLNMKYSLTIEVQCENNKVQENTDNAAVLENLRDQYSLLNNTYLPAVKRWIHTITKATGDSSLLKRAIDMKVALETAASKYTELNLPVQHKTRQDASDISDESDFQEVEEKEGYEECASCGIVNEHGLEFIPLPTRKKAAATDRASCGSKPSTSKSQPHWWGLTTLEEDEKDPTTMTSTLKNLATRKFCQASSTATSDSSIMAVKEDAQFMVDPGPSTSGLSYVSLPKEEELGVSAERSRSDSYDSSSEAGRRKLLTQAPKLPYDLDLYYWEEENLQAPTVIRADPELHRFWKPVDQEIELKAPEGAAALRTRVIEFTGTFEPVKWTCRAPLASGKLCPRRDRYKCPFHGLVIPRDEKGKPTCPEDAATQKHQEEEKAQQHMDWQDPEFLQDIKAATGLDLKVPVTKGKGKKKKAKGKKKYPGLTDIRALHNTARVRLAKKIFNRRAVKRVTSALDAMDYKKYRDKYGNQWSYTNDTL